MQVSVDVVERHIMESLRTLRNFECAILTKWQFPTILNIFHNTVDTRCWWAASLFYIYHGCIPKSFLAISATREFKPSTAFIICANLKTKNASEDQRPK